MIMSDSDECIQKMYKIWTGPRFRHLNSVLGRPQQSPLALEETPALGRRYLITGDSNSLLWTLWATA